MNVFFRFLILIFVATLALPAHCEGSTGCLAKFGRLNTEQCKQYNIYFQDYFDRLNNNYKLKGRFPHRIHSGTNVKLKLHKDGSVSDFRISSSCEGDGDMFVYWIAPIVKYRTNKLGTKMDDYVVEVIKNTPTKPFLEGMDYEAIVVNIEMGALIYNENESFGLCAIEVENYRTKIKYPPEFCIHITRNSRKRYK